MVIANGNGDDHSQNMPSFQWVYSFATLIKQKWYYVLIF
jgi:hypothetical protein